MGVSISNIGHTAQNKKINFKYLWGKTKIAPWLGYKGESTTEIFKVKPLLGYEDNPSLVENPN
jgi:hypothetical protein